MSDRTLKLLLLSGASSAVMMSLLAAGTAEAAPPQGNAAIVNTTLTAASAPSAYQAVVVNQGNDATVSANVTSGTEIIGSTGVPLVSVVGKPDTLAVLNNTASATAYGNTATTPVNLDLLGATSGVNGIAVSSLLTNTSPSQQTPTSITALANAETDGIYTVNFTTGTAGVTSNSITASALGNIGNVVLSGVVPLGYTGRMAGAATTSGTSPSQYATSGDIAVTTVLSNTTAGQMAGSGAQANDNLVELHISPASGSTAQIVTASPSVTGNSISASYAGNSGSNSVALGAGVQPGFTGTVGVTNVGLNSADIAGTGSAAALAQNNTIDATISDYSAGITDTLSGGALTVTGNSVSASATGNQSLPGSGSGAVAGNAISIGSGLSFSGLYVPGTSPVQNNAIALQSGAQSTVADLSVINDQRQIDSPLYSTTSGTLVQASTNSVTASTIAASANSLSSTATGNSATNAILTAGGTLAAAFSGTVAVSNSQVVSATDSAPSIGAATFGNTIEVLPGLASGDLVTSGTFNVQGDTTSATATGNSEASAITLSADALKGVSLPTTTGAATATSSGAASALAGASLTNAQLDTLPVTATATGNTDQIVATANSGLLSDSFSLGGTGNRDTIQAIATGSSATNDIANSGDAVSQTVALTNLQQATSGSIGANAVNDSLLISLGGGAATSGSTANLTENVVRALAYGNTASNSANLAATDTTGAAQNANGIAVNLASGTDAANGQVAVTSLQTLSNNTVSGYLYNGGNLAEISDTAALAKSNLAVSGNVVGALAFGNSVSNAANVTASATYGVSGGGQDPVGSVLNTQARSNASVWAENYGYDDGNTGLITANLYNAVTGSTVDSSGNSIVATAIGNNAGGLSGQTNANSLVVAGNVITSAAAAGSSFNGVEIDAGSTGTYANTVTTGTALSVGNVQNSTGSGTYVWAYNRDAYIWQVIGSSSAPAITSGSTLTALSNVINATAVDNTAANDISIGATALGLSAGIVNQQVAAQSGATSGVYAETYDGWTGIVSPNLFNNSTAQVNGNTTSADALGNNAQNALAANATNITIPAAAPTTGATNLAARGSFVPNTQGASGAPFDSGAYPLSATAFYDVVSNQVGSEAVQATNTWGGASLTLATPTSSTGQVNGNALIAVATANQAQSEVALTLGATQTNTVGGGQTWQEVAAVVNAQSNTGAVTAVNGIAGFESYVGGTATTTTLSVSNNTLSAFGGGNLAGGMNGENIGNTITLNGGSWSSTPPDNTSQGIVQLNHGTSGGIYNPQSFAVTNAQSEGAGGTVTVTNASNEVLGQVGYYNSGTSSYDDGSLVSSTLAVNSNAIIANGNNNIASNSITATGLDTFSASAGIANYQESLAALSVNALNNEIYGYIENGDALLSTLSVDSNQIHAVAVGNLASNAIAITADIVTLPGSSYHTWGDVPIGTTAAGGLAFDTAPASLTAPGYLAVLSDQRLAANVESLVSSNSGGGNALPVSSWINGNLLSSTANVNGNALFAVTAGNQASNALTLDPTATLTVTQVTSGSPAVIYTYAPVANLTNAQAVANGVVVSAAVDGTPTAPAAKGGDAAALLSFVQSTVSGSTMTLSTNSISALAVGNDAGGVSNDTMSNTLVASGGSITDIPTTYPLSGLSYSPAGGNAGLLTGDATLVLQNAQNGGTGTVQATLSNTDLSLLAAATVTNSALTIGGNSLSTAAYDNTAANAVSISGDTLAATVGLQNYQASGAATAAFTGGPAGQASPANPWLLLSVGGNVSDSQLNVTGNMVNAEAIANNAVNNATGTATQRSSGYPGMAGQRPQGISAADFGGVTGATVRADMAVDSQQLVTGTATVSAYGFVTFGVDTSIDVQAQAGLVGTQVNVTGNTGFSLAQANVASTSITASSVNGIAAPTLALLAEQQDSGAVTAAFTGQAFAPMGNLTASSVAISSNSFTAQAFGNSASNTLSSAGVNLGDVYNTTAQSAYSLTNAGDTLTASADAALGNFQLANSASGLLATVTSDIFNQDNPADLANLGFSAGLNAGLYASSAAESSNATLATSAANSATNSLTLDPSANLTQNAAETNAQQNLSGSTADATASVMMSFSSSTASLAMQAGFSVTDDSTRASATGNQATDTVTASTSDYSGYNTPASLTVTATSGSATSNISSTGDVTLSSLQLSDTTAGINASATATNSITATTSGGSVSSTFAVTGNVTSAYTTANSAGNTLNISATATLGATAGVSNLQNNLSGSSASATATNSVSLTTTGTASGVAAMNNGTASVSNNATQAYATGNQANNALNASGGAAYTAPVYNGSGAANGSGVAAIATGNFAVLNGQFNSGAISAAVSNTSNSIGINGGSNPGGAAGTVVYSSLTVSGNSSVAQAIGNQASNALNSTATNGTYAAGSLTNNQVNSGPVSAVASGVSNGVSVGAAGMHNSATTVGGNSISAVAAGNYTVNSMTSR